MPAGLVMVASAAAIKNILSELLNTIIVAEIKGGSIVLVLNGEFKLAARAVLNALILGLSRREDACECTSAAFILSQRKHDVVSTGPVRTTAVASGGSRPCQEEKRHECGSEVHFEKFRCEAVVGLLEWGRAADDSMMRETLRHEGMMFVFIPNVRDSSLQTSVVVMFLPTYKPVEIV